MKNEKMYDAITGIRDDHIENAAKTKMTKFKRRKIWLSSVAAILVAALLTGVLWPRSALTAYAVAEARYPDLPRYPKSDGIGVGQKYDTWRAARREQENQPEGYNNGLGDYFEAMTGELLSASGTENTLCSPLNIYMALAMLAETTGGESRQQILELLGADSVETLRAKAKSIWNANYSDDGYKTNILASSLWLGDKIPYHESTVKTLAENYYSSTYQGEMGTDEYNKALQSWLNEQTGGLLSDQTDGIEMSPETLLALATTVYYKAGWEGEFNPNNNTNDIFHSPTGDVTTEFMHTKRSMGYYWGEVFSAVSMSLKGGDRMWVILPDEGVDVQELLKDEQVNQMLYGEEKYENSTGIKVELSLPKFDVASRLDLIESLKNLGVTDVFSFEKADFSPITPYVSPEGMAISDAIHGARVIVDEEGVTGSAYTVMALNGSSAPPPDDDEVIFTVDRPFMFVVETFDGLNLFSGIVNSP